MKRFCSRYSFAFFRFSFPRYFTRRGSVCVLLVWCTLLAAALSARVAEAQRTSPADFDADGISDFVLISSSGNILSWSAFKADGSSQQSLGQFGRLGHDIALGDWLGAGIPQPATVSVTRNKIVWRIFSGGASTAQEFGSAGETALAGGDFNNDGIADAVTVVRNGSKLRWRIHQSLFTNSAAAPLEVSFGRPKDLYFFYNPDGAGDRLASITRRGAKAFTIRYVNPANGRISRKQVEQTIPSGQFRQRPLPLRLSNGKDALAFFQKQAKATRFSLLRAVKKAPQRFRIDATGDILVGNFAGESGEEIAVQNESGFRLFNPGAKKHQFVAAPAGIAVDEVNINQVGSSEPDNGGGDDVPSTPPDSNAPPLAGLRSVCERHSPIAMGELLIKSEISQHIPGLDPRATGYTVVCARLCPRNQSLANFFYADGSYAGSVAYYGTFSGNGKPRLYGAVGQAPQHFASQIAARARTIGNGKLYLQMSSARSGGATECKEFNPTGRNGSPY